MRSIDTVTVRRDVLGGHPELWRYSAWHEDEHEASDRLGATTEAEALAEAGAMFPSSLIVRVDDISGI